MPRRRPLKSAVAAAVDGIGTRSSAERVLVIPELVEADFLNMPIRQVLHAQRINKDCDAAIRTSYKLQEALFFKPYPLRTLMPPKNMSPDAVTIFDQVIQETEQSIFKGVLRSGHRDIVIVRNPFINYMNSVCAKVLCDASSGHLREKRAMTRREKVRDRPEATWRRTYVTQPATEFLSRAQKFGELGEEIVDIQVRLSDRQRQMKSSIHVEYADDLLGVLRGRVGASQVRYERSRSPIIHLLDD